MRSISAYAILLISANLLWADGVTQEKRVGRPISATDAQNYALLLNNTISLILEQYIRPVERADLVIAAVAGLYEEARVPFPDGVAAELRTVSTDQAMIALIARIRENLGEPESLRGQHDLTISMKSLTRALDPYCGLITSEELNRTNSPELTRGLGLEMMEYMGVGPMLVKTVFPGGPAQIAGIRPGDRITHVDGQPVANSSVAIALLSQRPMATSPTTQRITSLIATVLKPSAEEPRTVALEVRHFKPETILGVRRQENNNWDYWIDKNARIALVRIGPITSGITDDLVEVLGELKNQGLRGFIFDLRWCPGGSFTEAVRLAQLFVGEGLVATTKYRSGEMTEYRDSRERRLTDFPLLILVNGETSGGAELVAAAIQDNHRGTIAGQRTLGKASIQRMLGLPIPNTELKLTSGMIYRPSNKNLHRFPESRATDDWGVRPDDGLEFRLSPDTSRQLRQWWIWQTLRPGTSNERLPLDDPIMDAQVQDAVHALQKTIAGRTPHANE